MTSTSANMTTITASAGLLKSANQTVTTPSKGTGFIYGTGNSSANLPASTAPVVWNSTIANPTALNNSTSTATNSSGFDFAYSCDYSTASWESASFSWFRWHAASYIVTNSRYEVDTLYGTVFAPTTATSCLGAERVLGGQVLSVTSESETTTDVTWEIMTSSEATPFPTPKPSCSVGVDACSSLWSRYDGSMNALTTLYDAAVTALPTPPSCQDPRVDPYCQTCTISAAEVQMYYWPLVVIGDECDPDRQFLTPAPSIVGQPNTAVLGGYTFTSPTVYLSFDYIYALSETEWCGPRDIVSTIIAVPPEEVSTVRFSYIEGGGDVETLAADATTWTQTDPRLGLGTYTMSGWTETITMPAVRYLTATSAFPASFADFMGAVPVDAWFGEAEVAAWGGDVIVDALYSPNIAVPSMLRSLYPAWANCELFVSGVWDPPIPLQPASSVVGPSGVASTTSSSEVSIGTSAEPASQPGDQRPSSTKLPLLVSTTTAARGTESASTQKEPGASGSADRDTRGDTSTARSSTGIVSVSVIVEITSTRVAGQTSPDVDGGDRITTTSQIAKDPLSTTARGSSPAGESQSVQDPSNPNNGVSTIRQSALPISTTVTIEGTPIAVVSSGTVVVVGSQTVTSGAPPVTVNGQEYSLGLSGLVIGTTSTLLPVDAPSPTITAATALVGGSSVVAVVQDSFAVVGGQNLVQGGSAVTVASQLVSFGSSGLIVGGTSTIFTVAIPSAAASRTAVIGGSSVGAVVQGSIAVVGGNTLTLGGSPATIAGQEVTFASNGVIVAESSTLLPATSKSTEVAQPGQVISIDGIAVSIVPVNGGILISDGVTTATVNPGSTVTVQGHTIELNEGGNSITIDGSQTVSLDAGNRATGNIVSIGGTPISISRADGAVQLTSAGKIITLAPGETAIFAGHLVSVAPDGQSVTFDAARTVSVDAAFGAAPTVAKVVLLDGSPVALTRTAIGLTISDGRTSVQVASGQTVQFNGHTIAASADGTSVVIDGTRAVALDAVPAPSTSPDAVFMLGNTPIFIVLIGDSVVLSDGFTAILLTVGATITYNGHTVTLANDTQRLTVDGTQIVSLSAVSIAQLAMTASDGHVWSAIQYGDAILLTNGTASMILKPGQQVSLDNSALSNVAAKAPYTTLATLSVRPNAALITAPASLGGAVFTATFGTNGAILLIDGTHTVTLQPGQVATIDGVAVSAASDGSFVVVDGTRTVYQTAGSSTTSNGLSPNSALATPDASAPDGGHQAVASDPAEAGANKETITHGHIGGLLALIISIFTWSCC
nr:hypothetical protein B0A51_03336 [Rachicladosporium sp. CCFEE 5018]